MVGKYENKRFLIAEPTCEMKNQLTKELRSDYSDEVASSMSVKDTIFISQEDKEHFQTLHDSGRHHEASALLNNLYKRCCEEEPLAKAKQEELKQISEGINACKDSRITVTTHAMLIHTSKDVLESYDVIIIDEDILYLQILSNIKQISRGTLEFIRSSGKYGYSQIASEILKKSPKEYHDIMAYYRDIPEWGELSPSDTDDARDSDTSEFAMGQGENISDLRSAVSYYIDESGICHYFCCPELYNLNYIVLSATADASVYRDFFAKSGIGIMEDNVPRVRYTGSLTQYTYHSLGRRDIANRRKELYSFMDDLEETVTGNVYRISFMSEDMHAPKTNPWGLHYGNATGDNRAKGKNLIIYGTPYKNPIAYLLPCCYIYGETAVNTDSMKNRRVNYKGRNFLIMAYNDAHLFRFEMYSLESELEQCIGRARLLRTSPKVYLLSSFPCEQAELITTDYLAKYKGEERSA